MCTFAFFMYYNCHIEIKNILLMHSITLMCALQQEQLVFDFA